ncbi:MAG: Glutathione amide reductase [Alphaproteobacteria bacterium MarineAlpha9_Bin4]|nr:glutathione-disulfide reductase [Pelagibacterales bacterium]PPR26074.1 MAG: Glutathione amide reductase [Alphaproteobacteria bacterium MarineAlpha9_Bin4]|tara:strand:+ start:1418 stop:2782 length:1365 start_codon:yes stop_codon:yes gene_type:complete
MREFDLVVIGGGSGGVRAARIAAMHGAKVALFEKDRMGGTCVIRGCIPKKLLFYSAQFKNTLDIAGNYGWSIKNISKNFKKLIINKNKELKRLERIYEENAKKSGVKIFHEEAFLESKNIVKAGNLKLFTKNIIIATGGVPKSLDVIGNEYCINSDQIMELNKIPEKLSIIGSGYIAIEFAFIFSMLGAKVVLICRKNILRGFDDHLIKLVKERLIASGVKVLLNEEVKKISLKNSLKKISLKKSKSVLLTDEILVAIGRHANIKGLCLDNIGIKLSKKKSIIVDKNLKTNIRNIYAIGDVTDRVNLTPVAIAEGQFLSDKLFGGINNKKINLDNIGTAVFSSPPISTIGPTEKETLKKYKNIDIYESVFTSLKYSIVNKKIPTYIKILVNGKNKRIIAAHMFGDEAPEIIQVLAIAIQANATIDNFNNTMAIHPTVAEEFVTFKGPSRRIKRV